MRKFYVSIIVLMVTIAVSAQTKEYVDLGLPSGTLWATCNVGANAPEKYGDYFAWGETEPKKNHSRENYKWCTKSEEGYAWLSKYRCQKDEKSDFVDGKYVLDPEDDAATVNWGDEWCMPTYEQQRELENPEYTTMTPTKLNGVYGMRITSKKDKTKSIFLPCAGKCTEKGVASTNNARKYGYYWSSKCYGYSTKPYFGCASKLTSAAASGEQNGIERWYGCTIRPVRAKATAVKEPTREYVDLGLPSGTLWATCNLGADSPEGYGEYFAWGETEAKVSFSRGNYKWCAKYNSSYTWLSKYRTHIDDRSDFMDNKAKLDPEDDAVIANWGSEWCMPDFNQLRELEDSKYTTKKWTTLNGVNGVLITSKKDKSKSIFLPAAGVVYESGFSMLQAYAAGKVGVYWSDGIYSQSAEAYTGCATMASNSSKGLLQQHAATSRWYGCTIRPVRAKTTTSIVEVNDNQKAAKSGKYIVGGKLVIVKDGKKYNANGIEIK